MVRKWNSGCIYTKFKIFKFEALLWCVFFSTHFFFFLQYISDVPRFFKNHLTCSMLAKLHCWQWTACFQNITLRLSLRWFFLCMCRSRRSQKKTFRIKLTECYYKKFQVEMVILLSRKSSIYFAVGVSSKKLRKFGDTNAHTYNRTHGVTHPIRVLPSQKSDPLFVWPPFSINK